jgi:hypothetical protein
MAEEIVARDLEGGAKIWWEEAWEDARRGSVGGGLRWAAPECTVDPAMKRRPLSADFIPFHGSRYGSLHDVVEMTLVFSLSSLNSMPSHQNADVSNN